MATEAKRPLPSESAGATAVSDSDEERDPLSQVEQHDSEIADEHESTAEAAHHQEQTRRRRRKIIFGVVFAAFVIFIVVDSTTTQYIKTAIDGFLTWVHENPAAGLIAFTLFVFAATVLFIPGAILTIGAGFVFERAFGLGAGIVCGTATVAIGASAGAVLSFLIGRYLLRDYVEHLAERYSIVEALDIAMKEKGFRIMALLRLSPIVPFNAINYIAGVTSISLTAYTLANVAIIPGTTLFVFVGASAGCIANNMNDSGTVVTIVAFVVGAVFAVAAVFLVSFYGRRELSRILDARQESAEETTREDHEEPEEGSRQEEESRCSQRDEYDTVEHAA